ncbi:MAG: YbjQ family protein [Oscillospiraceae bacterium]|nr:YbjQ family protein [Oscillospiraceae bacterium]
MLILTINSVPGRDIEALGIVKGSTIQSKHIGKDIGSGFKTIIGGELKAYTQMMDEARQIATDRMIGEAEALGADAIIGVRFSTSAIMQGAAEMLAFGTAVRYR